MTASPHEDELLSLVTMGNPRLAAPSRPVEVDSIVTEAFQERLRRLARAMTDYEGIGIAAPQVGWCERFFTLLVEGTGEDGEPRLFLQHWINPEIVSVSQEQCWAWEGCLSVPGLRGWIRRPFAIAVRGYDSRGKLVSRELAGWPGRVFQHEFDHLDGLLFPYRVRDPRHLVMLEQLERRDEWPQGWPAPGARNTPQGEVLLDSPELGAAENSTTMKEAFPPPGAATPDATAPEAPIPEEELAGGEGFPALVTMGDPRLSRPSEPVEPGRIATQDFQERLGILRGMLDAHGANGVAAPQAGWFERHFVMRDPGGSGKLLHWINPEIVAVSGEQVWYWEGCLSLPGLKAYVGRSAAIAVRGLDERGEPISREFTGWEAHLFQHEFDHLDGVLFPYRVADPRHIVTAEELEQREGWPEDWPAPGARDTPIRTIRTPGGRDRGDGGDHRDRIQGER